MLDAVTQDQLCPVKIEDLSSCLPALQDLQLSYNKFKQLFLIGKLYFSLFIDKHRVL